MERRDPFIYFKTSPEIIRLAVMMYVRFHSSVFSHFNKERSLSSRTIFKQNRTAVLLEWRRLCTA
jgi:putative transposase